MSLFLVAVARGEPHLLQLIPKELEIHLDGWISIQPTSFNHREIDLAIAVGRPIAAAAIKWNK